LVSNIDLFHECSDFYGITIPIETQVIIGRFVFLGDILPFDMLTSPAFQKPLKCVLTMLLFVPFHLGYSLIKY
jgi:hypothetical protein